MVEKIFVHYIDRNEKGQDINVSGYFELIKEDKNFIVLKTEKNMVRIPYHRIIKLKGGKI